MWSWKREARGTVRQHKSMAGADGVGARMKEIRLRSIICTPDVGEGARASCPSYNVARKWRRVPTMPGRTGTTIRPTPMSGGRGE